MVLEPSRATTPFRNHSRKISLRLFTLLPRQPLRADYRASLHSRYPDYFGNRNAICSRMSQGEPPEGCVTFPKKEALILTDWAPKRMIRPSPPPTGKTHSFPLEAFQFAVRMGDDDISQPFFKL